MKKVGEVVPRFEVYKDDCRVCLWCKNRLGVRFSTEEYHIFPRKITESVGYKYTIPTGIVCDKCNHLFAANSESALAQLMKERLAFLTKNRASQNVILEGLTWHVSQGKLSIRMDRLLQSNSQIPHPKYVFNSEYLRDQIVKMNIRNQGLVLTSLQKIALEMLYCDYASSYGDFSAYNTLVDPAHNFYRLTSLIKDFVSRKQNFLFNNVSVVSSLYCFQGNINCVNIKEYKNQAGVGGECVFIFLCGIQFLVSFLPQGNASLTKDELSSLVKTNYHELVNEALAQKSAA